MGGMQITKHVNASCPFQYLMADLQSLHNIVEICAHYYNYALAFPRNRA
jgi:hypothetical protein